MYQSDNQNRIRHLWNVVCHPASTTISTAELRTVLRIIVPPPTTTLPYVCEWNDERWSWFVFDADNGHWFSVERLYSHSEPQARSKHRRHRRRRRRLMSRNVVRGLLYIGGKHARSLRTNDCGGAHDQHVAWLTDAFRTMLRTALVDNILDI